MRLPRNFRPRAPGRRGMIRGGAFVALAAAVVVPHVRRQLRIPAAVTVASTVAAPAAIAVLWPRSRGRDVALFAGQMWAFAVSHELPYDDPDRLRERLKIEYPVRIDRKIGRGRLPNVRLQRALHDGPFGQVLTRFSAWTHWFWFAQPYLVLIWILIRHNDRFPQSARQMAAVFDIGCAAYFLVPTAPPWWASENGYTEEEVRRVMIEFGERIWGPVWTRAFGLLASNPWAAMPSLHFATALMAAILLSDAGGRTEKVLGWGYAGSLGFALVYLGEHYVTDLLAGAAVVGAVRTGEPLVRPVVKRVNARLQRLEAIAGGA
ncbi:MAG: phosphatase PAP2 family protein [Solirubrobacterales bacterium]|nr:phosphatase PAP2 family protein [Solirubrobacterales bacterium]